MAEFLYTPNPKTLPRIEQSDELLALHAHRVIPILWY
jgi:hypothetical protein